MAIRCMILSINESFLMIQHYQPATTKRQATSRAVIVAT